MFSARDVYPDAAAVFSTRPEPVRAIKDNCYVGLDTNALLVPYGIGENSLQDLERIYRKLVSEKRLLVPGQVAREFAKTRPTKLAEVHQQLSRIRDGIQVPSQGGYPLLNSLPEYNNAADARTAVDGAIKQYRTALGVLIDRIRGWIWDEGDLRSVLEGVAQVVEEIFAPAGRKCLHQALVLVQAVECAHLRGHDSLDGV